MIHPFHSQTAIGLTEISYTKASQLISEYNVYFQALGAISDEYASRVSNFDSVDKSIYKMFTYKSFHEQFTQIQSCRFPEKAYITFYTDYKHNPEIVENRLNLAHYILQKKCKTINTSNLRKETKLPIEVVDEYTNSLEKYKTASLFD